MPGIFATDYAAAEAAMLAPKLVRHRIKAGKLDVFNQWMLQLREQSEECRESMRREGLRYEAVFTSEEEGHHYVYWITFARGFERQSPEQSELPIDRLHLHYWCECIDPDFEGQECAGFQL